jgi:aldehyde dehydrogenase (NAD+)
MRWQTVLAEPQVGSPAGDRATQHDLGYIARSSDSLNATFGSGRTRPYGWRIGQLDALLRMLSSEEGPILEALAEDLGKSRIEGWATEINETTASVKYLRRHLNKWMKPERVGTPLRMRPGKSWVQREPLGVVLVISPWNFPLLLSLNPLAGALAAGNAVLLKPSEVSPATSALMARLIPRYLDRDAVAVIEGGVVETTEVLKQRFDHIFYTGNGTVGRIVMEAASRHLTPVTLELGGKNPCVVDERADLEVAARRIAWTKFGNCGQTCVAPDYLLVHETVHDRFVALLTKTITSFYGPRPAESPDYGRIINERHHHRLMDLLAGSGDVALGAEGSATQRYIAPTVLTNVPADAPVMRDEIFGPILPVLRVRDLDEAIGFIRARPKPLALYLFSSDKQSQERVLNETSSGGVVINHVAVHLSVPGLPFGGVGASGMGVYHGKSSLDTFSNRKAVLKKGTGLDPDLLYPPYTPSKESWLRRLM